MAKKQVAAMDEYQELLKKVEDARNEVAERAKGAVASLFRMFFMKHPEVKAIGWTQYTPYFNDGEACVFGVHSFYLTLKSADFENVSDFWSDAYEFTDSPKDKALKAALDNLTRLVNEDIFEAAFGDNAMVIATPKGFHISHYQHE